MRFKRIAFSFIVFANTLLLAHSIVPHHHHNGLVKNLNIQNRNENNTLNFDDHAHDDTDDNHCALNREILIPGKSIRTGADQQYENLEEPCFQDNNSAIQISTGPITNLCSSSLNNTHYGLSQYLFLLNNSLGLRAPPLS